jgi:hypothetical protein
MEVQKKFFDPPSFATDNGVSKYSRRARALAKGFASPPGSKSGVSNLVTPDFERWSGPASPLDTSPSGRAKRDPALSAADRRAMSPD